MIVEGDSSTRSVLNELFSKKGYQVRTFENALSAREWYGVSHDEQDVILINSKTLGERAANELIADSKVSNPLLPVVLICDSDSMSQAAEVIRSGKYHYLLAPITAEHAEFVVEVAFKQAESAKTAEAATPKNLGSLFTNFPSLDELEKEYMKIVLEKTKGRKERAAKILGINRRTLYRKEREYGWVSEEEQSASPHLDQSASH